MDNNKRRINIGDRVICTSSGVIGEVIKFYNTIPNSGGLLAFFAGDNDMAAFGKKLASFGASLTEYSDSVSTIATEKLSGVVVEFRKLVNLASSISGVKTDGINPFGNGIKSLGKSLSSYYGNVSEIATDQLSSVITEVRKLVSLINGMSGLDASGTTAFSDGLKTLGKTGVDDFIAAFTDATSQVTTAAETMLTTFITGANSKQTELTTTFTTLVEAALKAINDKQTEFQTAGQTLMIKFIAGVKTQDSPARTTFTTIISGCLTAIKNKYTEFTSVGSECMVKFIAGVKTQDSPARTAFTTIISGCLTAIKNKYAEFTTVGSECMVKLISGVKSKDSELRTAFTTSLSGAVTAIRNYYSQFHSAGAYLADGFAAGIRANAAKAAAEAKAMADAAAAATANALEEKMPVNKVVYDQRILIDLTEDTVTEDVLLRGYTAHKADGTVIVGKMLEGYPDEFFLCERIQDSSGNDIFDSFDVEIESKTVYLKA